MTPDLHTTTERARPQPEESVICDYAALLSQVLLSVEQLPIEERTRILMAPDRATGLNTRQLLERLASDINAITPLTSRILG